MMLVYLLFITNTFNLGFQRNKGTIQTVNLSYFSGVYVLLYCNNDKCHKVLARHMLDDQRGGQLLPDVVSTFSLRDDMHSSGYVSLKTKLLFC